MRIYSIAIQSSLLWPKMKRKKISVYFVDNASRSLFHTKSERMGNQRWTKGQSPDWPPGSTATDEVSCQHGFITYLVVRTCHIDESRYADALSRGSLCCIFTILVPCRGVGYRDEDAALWIGGSTPSFRLIELLFKSRKDIYIVRH